MVLYIYCFLKKTKNSNEETQKELIKDNYKGVKITEYISKYDKSKYYIFKIIIVIFLDLLCDLAFFIFYETNKNATYEKIENRIENDITNNLDVLMRYILSSLLLKIKIKRHHKFSFIIISITSLLILILNIIEIGQKIILDFFLYFFLLNQFCTLQKKLLLNHYLIMIIFCQKP